MLIFELNKRLISDNNLKPKRNIKMKCGILFFCLWLCVFLLDFFNWQIWNI